MKVTTNNKVLSFLDEERIEYECLDLNSEIMSFLLSELKLSDRTKKRINLNLENKFSKEVAILGDSLEDIMEMIQKRQANLTQLVLNLEGWSYMYSILPKIVPHMQNLRNLKELTIISNNKSLYASVSNSCTKHLASLIASLKQVQKLHLEFAEQSPERKKFIKDDGLLEFAMSFRDLKELRELRLNLDGWGSFQRSKLKLGNEACQKLFENLFALKKSFKVIVLRMNWWNTLKYECLIYLFRLLLDQKDLNELGLHMIEWSYYNDSNHEQALLALRDLLKSLKNVKLLRLSLFNIKAYQNPNNQYGLYHTPQNFNNIRLLSESFGLNQNLLKLELKMLDYVPEEAIKIIRNALLKQDNLNNLQLNFNTPYDEYFFTLKSIKKRTLNREFNVYQIHLLKKRTRKYFRKEIIYDICKDFLHL